jgi:hypothetical protein
VSYTQSPFFLFIYLYRGEQGTVVCDTIQISYDDDTILADCVSAIVVPEIAMTEPGYIKTMTAGMVANSKHEFHAMAQMAYYQYQDGELDVAVVRVPIRIESNSESEEISSGMVIYRDSGGVFHVLIHEQLNRKKMLEATNRYCTRWVRLDI